jgi:hypothetical protein
MKQKLKEDMKRKEKEKHGLFYLIIKYIKSIKTKRVITMKYCKTNRAKTKKNSMCCLKGSLWARPYLIPLTE